MLKAQSIYMKSVATFELICIVVLFYLFSIFLMRFIKKFFFICILIVLAFFVYRLISPTSANALLSDIKSFSNDTLGTHFALSQPILESTWVVLDVTGVVLEETWILQEFASGDELLLNDVDLSQQSMSTWTVVTWTLPVVEEPKVVVPLQTPPSPTTTPLKTPTLKKTTTTPKATTSSSSSTIRQAVSDLKAIFGE